MCEVRVRVRVSHGSIAYALNADRKISDRVSLPEPYWYPVQLEQLSSAQHISRYYVTDSLNCNPHLQEYACLDSKPSSWYRGYKVPPHHLYPVFISNYSASSLLPTISIHILPHQQLILESYNALVLCTYQFLSLHYASNNSNRMVVDTVLTTTRHTPFALIVVWRNK